MSSLSPNLGFQLADGTDIFDNDKYIKPNFQYIDANILPSSKTVQTKSALKMEVVSVSFSASGSVNNVQASGITYANTYTNAPTISPANITQPISYSDDLKYPYIFSVSNTSFGVKLMTADGSNFAAGTIVMDFIVIGS